MLRPIDAYTLNNALMSWYNDTEDETEKSILRRVMQMVVHAPTLTPPNEPLTLDSRLTPKMVTCPKGWKGVRYTRFHCPGCKKVLKKGEAYCHKCGQALIFPAARYDKENNRIWLDFSDRRPPEGEEDTQ